VRILQYTVVLTRFNRPVFSIIVVARLGQMAAFRIRSRRKFATMLPAQDFVRSILLDAALIEYLNTLGVSCSDSVDSDRRLFSCREILRCMFAIMILKPQVSFYSSSSNLDEHVPA
jgi:hypothetical protein